MNALTIANTAVRQDSSGRYFLNDLHHAAGGEERHSPNRWTRTDSYQSLVSELTPDLAFAPAESIRGGATPGTYVCKELVYAYAMWISPRFHIQVIRAYDAMQTGAVVPAPTFDPKPVLSDAIAVYRESMTALLLAHTKKQAHLLACVSATRVTGFDLESMWAPAYPKATVGRVPQASLLPWHKPNPHAKQLERLARYLRNAKHLPVPKRAPAFTIEQCTRLLGQGYIPRQMLLKVMHVPASEFNLLIAEGKEAGIVRELNGIEFNYAGTLYVAGGAA